MNGLTLERNVNSTWSGVSRLLWLPLLTLALALTGCSADGEGRQLTARGLQAQVLEVSQAAADGDHAGALVRLQELQSLVNEALARKTITEETHASILSAMDLVRQDLELAVQAEEAPPPAPATPVGDQNEDKDDEDNDDDDRPGKGKGRGNDN